MHRNLVLSMVMCLLPLQAADSTGAIHWRASDLIAADKKAASKLNPATKVGSEQLLDSATLIYRTGSSEPEIHEKRADMIFVREGEGVVLVGGKLIEQRTSGPGELRGGSIDGGTTYKIAPGDAIYVPANTAHQFVVQPGQHFIAVIVKIPTS
jgi:mannose-6-phosphate isomerase-like protein (cupin superfamily)